MYGKRTIRSLQEQAILLCLQQTPVLHQGSKLAHASMHSWGAAVCFCTCKYTQASFLPCMHMFSYPLASQQSGVHTQW